MTTSMPPEVVDDAREIYMDADIYADFSHTADHRLIVGCCDPRAYKTSGRMKIYVNTPGGGYGLGVDSVIATDAVEGRQLSLPDGMEKNKQEQLGVVANVHSDCKFQLGLVAIIGEMASLGDQTSYRVESLMDRYQLNDIEPHIKRAQRAAEHMVELLKIAPLDEDTMLAVADRLHPKHKNVRVPVGESQPGFYIMNHDTQVGLDRHVVHREIGLGAHAYHDSVAAMLGVSMNIGGQSLAMGAHRVASGLLRSAATATVLSKNEDGSHNGLTIINVSASNSGSGLKFDEEMA